ncbi:hypothetical protein EV586_101576 [Tumebacillus sp. BK434]|uniref:hypothetical protein n=1 Tax=Tumebacillus sp. BK434 TaxID=2512169 RepID=UPI00104C6F24|nr:hypothetical protein [Tumebacillus sp. BK434]TCP59360.1 hypothetical protein EV586_101576 [Tumebacillus sp. BK434]
MNSERKIEIEQRVEREAKQAATPLHYEFAKGYLPTVNPKTDELHDHEDASRPASSSNRPIPAGEL